MSNKPYRILVGDCRASLRSLPEASVHCCVTSPPYYGLRAYGTEPQVWGGVAACAHAWGGELPGLRARWGDTDTLSEKQASNGGSQDLVAAQERPGGHLCERCGAWRGELGGEPDPELFIEHLVEVFREVRRVLHPSGTLWVNIGDSYNAFMGNRCTRSRYAGTREAKEIQLPTGYGLAAKNLKPKDLLGIPWMLAFALQADGWYLRCDIIWSKPSAMPESVHDRPTKSHEYLFLLAKEAQYFYDKDAIRIPYNEASLVRYRTPMADKSKQIGARQPGREWAHENCMQEPNPLGRNRPSVWVVQKPQFNARRYGVHDVGHYASYPEELVEPCILAGTSAAGCCPVCRSPLVRDYEIGAPDPDWQRACGGDRLGQYHGEAQKEYDQTGVQNPSAVKKRILARLGRKRHVGWKPTCEHAEAADPVPCTVLDPFAGTGTTGAVALMRKREAVLCELQPDYVRIMERRLHNPLTLYDQQVLIPDE